MTSIVYFGVTQTRVLSLMFSEVATTFSEHHTFWFSVVGTKTFFLPKANYNNDEVDAGSYHVYKTLC